MHLQKEQKFQGNTCLPKVLCTSTGFLSGATNSLQYRITRESSQFRAQNLTNRGSYIFQDQMPPRYPHSKLVVEAIET